MSTIEIVFCIIAYLILGFPASWLVARYCGTDVLPFGIFIILLWPINLILGFAPLSMAHYTNYLNRIGETANKRKLQKSLEANGIVIGQLWHALKSGFWEDTKESWKEGSVMQVIDVDKAHVCFLKDGQKMFMEIDKAKRLLKPMSNNTLHFKVLK